MKSSFFICCSYFFSFVWFSFFSKKQENEFLVHSSVRQRCIMIQKFALEKCQDITRTGNDIKRDITLKDPKLFHIR
jgi:hypothetical protein